VEIDKSGRTVSHKWFMISGQTPAGGSTGTIEVIDFAETTPRWRVAGTMANPVRTSKAVVLPDGKVLIGQGLNPALPTYEQREGLRFQMFDPATGATTLLAKTTVSRGLHGTATLLPDATVFFAGENREALVRPDDPSFPLVTSYAGTLPRGDPDQGVPVGQLFSPPYLFTESGGSATRPVITESPAEISYRGTFDITVAGAVDQIASVAILRSDHNTHSLTTGDRYVKLAFRQQGNPRNAELRVVTPKVPAQAVPGIYMLFVVDRNGVPSVGRKLVLEPETRGSSDEFR
jgi:galactose oxidase